VDLTFILLFVSFVLVVAVIYLTVIMVRKWYITFSPKEMAFFGLVMFLMGWVISSYLLGSSLQIFEGSILILVLFAVFVYRWYQRRNLRKIRQEAGLG
jgi:hypothetical protein